jgi:predicted dehydrogenase
MKEINVALIGCGFMGKAHSNAYRQVCRFLEPKARPVMKVLCDLDKTAVESAREKFGWQETETSWKKVMARPDIDLVDISTPGNTHCAIAMAAAKAGKHILCEKPIANTLDEAKLMLRAAEKAGIKHMAAFNYRRVPAVALAKQMVKEKSLGRIFHFRAVYLQDWIIDPKFPLVWRLQKPAAGSGPHGDLNAHIIDLALHLVGDIEDVVGMETTFIKERPLLKAVEPGLSAGGISRNKGKVTVDDATIFLARFTSGALGSFEATRFAQGRKNYNRFEINGEKGSIVFNLERMNELQYFDATLPQKKQGWSTILATEGVHPYLEAWWPPGHIIGWEHTFTHEVYDFLNCIATGRTPSPNFAEGVKTQAVLEAVSVSCKRKRWVKISEFWRPRKNNNIRKGAKK